MQTTVNKRLAASGQVKGTSDLTVVGVLLSGTANASCVITQDADGSGTAVMTFRVLANTSQFFPIPATYLSQAYATLAGAGVEAVLFYE